VPGGIARDELNAGAAGGFHRRNVAAADGGHHFGAQLVVPRPESISWIDHHSIVQNVIMECE